MHYFLNLKAFALLTALLAVLAFNNSEGVLIRELRLEEIKSILKNIEITVFHKPAPNGGIASFDVNSNGDIVMAFDNYLRKTVSVYDRDMNFKYGFELETAGSFGVWWDDENVAIHHVRGDLSITFDDQAHVILMRRIEDTIESNRYWHNYVFATRRQADGVQYRLRNDFGLLNLFTAMTYSKLVKITPDGAETILYDASYDLLAKMVSIMVLVFIMVSIVVTHLIRLTIKTRAEYLEKLHD